MRKQTYLTWGLCVIGQPHHLSHSVRGGEVWALGRGARGPSLHIRAPVVRVKCHIKIGSGHIREMNWAFFSLPHNISNIYMCIKLGTTCSSRKFFYQKKIYILKECVILCYVKLTPWTKRISVIRQLCQCEKISTYLFKSLYINIHILIDRYIHTHHDSQAKTFYLQNSYFLESRNKLYFLKIKHCIVKVKSYNIFIIS